MEADLQPLNHGLNSAWRLAQDRERWKQLVETATLQSSRGMPAMMMMMMIKIIHINFKKVYMEISEKHIRDNANTLSLHISKI